MVSRPLLKDALREIRATLSRFIAILVIIFIGTAFFVGIKTTGPDMRATADRYFKDTHFMDFYLLSTVGFNDADVAAIRAAGGVRGVMPAYSVDALTTTGGHDSVVRVMSLPLSSNTADPDFINQPHLISGRLPEKPGEALVEPYRWTGRQAALGSKVTLRSGNDDDLSDSLGRTAFTVVGVVESPLYLSHDRGTSTIGNGSVESFLLIPDADFKMLAYTAVYVTADLPAKATAYSKAYDDQIAKVEDALTAVADRRQVERQNEITAEATGKIDVKQKEYDAAAADTRAKLDNAVAQLNQGKQQLVDGRAQYDTQKKAYEQGIADGQAKLDAARAQLSQGEQAYAANLAALQAKGLPLAAAQQQLAPVLAQLDASAAQLADGEKALAAQKQQGEQGLATAEAKLDSSVARLAASEQNYLAGRATAEKELADGAAQLADARAKLADLPKVTWYVLGRDKNSGYAEYQNATERMDAIALVFPVVFVLVAILICLTSMSRMVEEQRGFIGTAKALGYSRGAVAVKFLLYGSLAAVAGCAAGVVVGFSFMPTAIFKAYSMLFTLPKFIRVFDVPFALAALAVSLAVTTISALFVCYSELQSHAAHLLRPRAPKAGKRVWLERIGFLWRRMSFTQKVTARNLIRYRSRFYMTVVGVAGCTALLLTGLGLNDALRDIGTKQFGEIHVYQMSVGLRNDLTSAGSSNGSASGTNDSAAGGSADRASGRAAIVQTLERQPGFAGSEEFLERNIDVSFNGKEKSCGLIVPADTARMSDFIRLRDRVTGRSVGLPADAVVLTEKLASQLGIHTGDSITIKNGDEREVTAKVADTAENYFLHYLYMSPVLYQRLYGEVPGYNQINVRLTTPLPGQQESKKAIVPLAGVSGVELIEESQARFQDIIDSISTVFLILTIAAAALSFTVLYTLTTININERLREIATIKVLGFHDREVAGFVLRENLVLALIGAAGGLVFGTYLARFIIGTAEVDMVMFGREIHPLSYVMAAALTMVFTGLVNLVMLRPLARIDMIEALKTVE